MHTQACQSYEIISHISASVNQIETWLHWPLRESNEISQLVACQKDVSLVSYLRRFSLMGFHGVVAVFMENMSISLVFTAL